MTTLKMGQLIRVIRGPATGAEGYVQNGWGLAGCDPKVVHIKGLAGELWLLPEYVEPVLEEAHRTRRR